MAECRIPTFEEVRGEALARMTEINRQAHIIECWQRWAEASCLEWNGAHDWMLDIDLGSVTVACAHCPAEPFPDVGELVCLSLPVDIAIHTSRHWEGLDVDIEVEVTPR